MQKFRALIATLGVVPATVQAEPRLYFNAELNDRTLNYTGDGSPPDAVTIEFLGGSRFLSGTHFPADNPLDSTSRFEYEVTATPTRIDFALDIYFNWQSGEPTIAWPILFLDSFTAVVTEPGEDLPDDFGVRVTQRASGTLTGDQWPENGLHLGNAFGEERFASASDALLDVEVISGNFVSRGTTTLLGEDVERQQSGSPFTGGGVFNNVSDIGGADDLWVNGFQSQIGQNTRGASDLAYGALLEIDLTYEMITVPAPSVGTASVCCLLFSLRRRRSSSLR